DEVAELLAADGDAVVGGNALVGTLGVALARAENVGPHIVARDVVARRQTGLEQKHGTPRVGYRRAADDHLDTAGSADRLDALVGIARVAKNLFVFLIPVVDEIPLERRIRREWRGPRQRRRIVPHRVFDAPGADLDRPVARMSAALIEARVIAWHQQVPTNVA